MGTMIGTVYAGGKGSVKKAGKPKPKGMRNKRRSRLRKIEENKRKESKERRAKSRSIYVESD